jgi:hypothetical protein
MKFRDPQGRTVNVTEYDTRADLPIFCAEIVDGTGEVVELIDPIFGHSALTWLAANRRWKESA